MAASAVEVGEKDREQRNRRSCHYWSFGKRIGEEWSYPLIPSPNIQGHILSWTFIATAPPSLITIIHSLITSPHLVIIAFLQYSRSGRGIFHLDALSIFIVFVSACFFFSRGKIMRLKKKSKKTTVLVIEGKGSDNNSGNFGGDPPPPLIYRSSNSSIWDGSCVGGRRVRALAPPSSDPNPWSSCKGFCSASCLTSVFGNRGAWEGLRYCFCLSFQERNYPACTEPGVSGIRESPCLFNPCSPHSANRLPAGPGASMDEVRKVPSPEENFGGSYSWNSYRVPSRNLSGYLSSRFIERYIGATQSGKQACFYERRARLIRWQLDSITTK